MVNFGNISIMGIRLGATQVQAAYLGRQQFWGQNPVVPEYDIQSIGRSVSQQGTSIEISEQAGETITLYIKTNAIGLTGKQVCAAVYLNSTDVTPYSTFAFSNVSLAGGYITGTTPDVSTWLPSGFPQTYSTLYMKTWIQNAGYIDPASTLGDVLNWTAEEAPPVVEPLCFTAGQINSLVQLNKQGTPDPISLEYSYDKNTWTDYAWSGNTGDVIMLSNVNDKVYFRAKTENQTISKDNSNYYQFIMSEYIVASGNIQTLLKADGTRTDAPDYCYYNMFRGCTSLTTAPALPATILADNCYSSMFEGCTSLTSAPALPATTLAIGCYYYMFEGCTSLTAAPTLPATTLANGCYNNMFRGCTSLTTAPALPATILADNCYSNMFFNCSSLTIAPALPATTLANGCYQYMFRGCTSLTTAPTLPATTLAIKCYNSMFYGCTTLNSITLGYTGDFGSAPYQAFTNWVRNVASSGTFYYNGTDKTTGTAAIPDGWTVTPF